MNNKNKVAFLNWIGVMLKEFFKETTEKAEYEIVDIFECQKTGATKAIIKFSGRHFIEKNIHEIVTDNYFIQSLDKKTIRTLTYMATIERMKPDYSIVTQQLNNEMDDYILEIKSRNKKEVVKKSPSEVTKDKSLLLKLGPLDANRVGYLAGVRETVRDFELKSKILK